MTNRHPPASRTRASGTAPQTLAIDLARPGTDMTSWSVKLPLVMVSVANKREHWSVRARRTKGHRLVGKSMHPAGLSLPCTVQLTRIAPRQLDDDNLRSAFKALRDGIADRLGVKDNDPRVRWEYAQERGKPKEYAARVTITAVRE